MKLSPFIVLCLYLQGSALFLLDTCVFHLSQLFLSVTKKKQPWFLRRAVLLYSSHLRDCSFFGHKIDFCNKKSNFGEILQNVVNVMLIFTGNGTINIKIKFCLTKLHNNDYDYSLYKSHSTVYKLYLFSVTQ